MISYRKAEQKDLNEIMEVISNVSEEAWKESKEKISKRISESQLLCCLDNIKIIGFLGWDAKYRENPENWYLEQIMIQKDYHGQGIGKEAFDLVVKKLREKQNNLK
jgi:N-acetylglutamate synthase-like GNAT family acetyltransferase